MPTMPHKLYLTLNAAEKNTQFLISCAKAGTMPSILHSKISAQPKASTEFLIPAIEKACQKLKISIHDFNFIATVAGPGNFMGIRLTAVTLAAIKRALPETCMQAPLNYMQCLALNIPLLANAIQEICPTYSDQNENSVQLIDSLTETLENKIVRVLTTATKNSVHVCDFTFKKMTKWANFSHNQDGQIFPIPKFPTALYTLDETNTFDENTEQAKQAKQAKQTEQELRPFFTSSHVQSLQTHEKDKSQNKSRFCPHTSTPPDFIIGSGLLAHEEYFVRQFPKAICITEKALQNVNTTFPQLATITQRNKKHIAQESQNTQEAQERQRTQEKSINNTFFEIPLSDFSHTPSMQALHTLTTSEYTEWQKEDITPLYLKECDALQNLDSIATSQGRNPIHAHAELEKIMNTPFK